jgi:hypothetical protein
MNHLNCGAEMSNNTVIWKQDCIWCERRENCQRHDLRASRSGDISRAYSARHFVRS